MSSSHFQRGHWLQRCHWASPRRLEWLWWNSQGSLAEGTMATVRVCFSITSLVTSFSDKRVSFGWWVKECINESIYSYSMWRVLILELLYTKDVSAALPVLVLANNVICKLYCKSLWKKSASYFSNGLIWMKAKTLGAYEIFTLCQFNCEWFIFFIDPGWSLFISLKRIKTMNDLN